MSILLYGAKLSEFDIKASTKDKKRDEKMEEEEVLGSNDNQDVLLDQLIDEMAKRSYLNCEILEHERLKRFRIVDDKIRGILSRLLSLQIISDFYESKTVDLIIDRFQFYRTLEKKPYVRAFVKSSSFSLPGFNYNATHHGDWVLAICSDQYLVGIDTMRYDLPRDGNIEKFFSTMKMQFTQLEWNTIRSAANPLIEFYRHWSLKESYIKAIGIGLGFELQRAEFSFLDKNFASVSIDGHLQPEWTFLVRELDESHCFACAFGPMREAFSKDIFQDNESDSSSFVFVDNKKRNDDYYIPKMKIITGSNLTYRWLQL